MRAETLIVGAVAVASCLIATALVLSNRNSGSTEPVVVQRRQKPEQPSPARRARPEVEAGFGGSPTACNTHVSVGPDTSCQFGLSVWSAYRSSGGGAEVSAHSPVTGRQYRMTCRGAAPTICTGGEGATVYLGP
jgi:hypothetical protein